mmetsp:Transcript_1460/g.2078  ORF Transcript_1460/g.2078 Transcript_1460/m.2078 type:complete len:90 (-) Transcript_1460:1644-1913(-)
MSQEKRTVTVRVGWYKRWVEWDKRIGLGAMKSIDYQGEHQESLHLDDAGSFVERLLVDLDAAYAVSFETEKEFRCGDRKARALFVSFQP